MGLLLPLYCFQVLFVLKVLLSIQRRHSSFKSLSLLLALWPANNTDKFESTLICSHFSNFRFCQQYWRKLLMWDGPLRVTSPVLLVYTENKAINNVLEIWLCTENETSKRTVCPCLPLLSWPQKLSNLRASPWQHDLAGLIWQSTVLLETQSVGWSSDKVV